MSTGQSSLNAVDAIRQAGGELIGMVAVFSYGFPVAEEAFRKAGVKLVTLSDYQTLIHLAVETGYIRKEEVAILEQWRADPSGWRGPGT